MAYTIKQLTMAWTAVHDGVEPTGTVLADLQNRASQNAAGTISDAAMLGYVLNSADSTTALAVLSYQFFTGKSPSKDGLAYLVNSPTNTADLNDAYYARFNIENRYINFAANLGVQGEGAAGFATKYGAMGFADYIASIYETIIGATYAKAAGIDVAAALAYLAGRYDAIKATAQSAGMITPGMSQTQIDLAVKAAAAGFLLGEAIKADVGLYAGAANNFMLALAKGDAVYNTDITTTYKPSATQGIGQPVTTAPTADTLPGAVLPPPPPPPPVAEPRNFTLGVGANTLTGANTNDTFTASDTTFDASDVLNGSGGTDTLKLIGAKGSAWTVPNASVTDIEIVEISNDSGLTANTKTWTGVTTLKGTSVGDLTLTAASTTNIIAKSTQGAGNISIVGGHDVTVTSTGATTGTIIVGSPDAPTGAVVINRQTTGPVAAGGITVDGGTTVDITQTATNAVNTTQTNGSVVVNGTTQTTSVTVKAPHHATADASTPGINTGNVTINDVYKNSTTTAGTITHVEIDGASDVTIRGNAVGTLKLSGVTGMVYFNYTGTVPATTPTLGLTLNDSQVNTLIDDGLYNGLDITTGSLASSVSTLVFPSATTLNVGGSSQLTVDSWIASNLQTVTTSGAGGLVANLSSLATLTSVDTSASTGASSVKIDGTKTTFTGGAGDDTVTLSTASITQAITLGGGDDKLVLAYGMVLPGFSISGGAGTADVLSVDADDALAAAGSPAFANAFTGFERLNVRGGGIFTVDVAELGGYHYVISEGGLGVFIKGLVSGDTLEFTGNGTATRIDPTTFGGANDTLNVVLRTPSGMFGRLLGTGVENIAVSLVDDAHGVLTWRAMNVDLKTATFTGDAGLTLTLDSTVLTSVDASALTGDFTWITGALSGPTTIKGAAAAGNYVDASSAVGVITYEGSSGDDYVKLGASGGTVHAGNGNNTVFALSTIASTITTGSGNDNVFVGGGANTVNVGSGTDFVGIDTATSTTTDYTTITGMGAGDKIEFSSVTFSQPTAGAAVVWQGSYLATLTEALDGDGSTTPILTWFTDGTDTYVVVDNSASHSFDPNVDYVVKLMGPHTLGAVTSFDVTLTS